MRAKIEAAIPIADFLQPAQLLGLRINYRDDFLHVNRNGTNF
jgi:hypothetical protein